MFYEFYMEIHALILDKHKHIQNVHWLYWYYCKFISHWTNNFEKIHLNCRCCSPFFFRAIQKSQHQCSCFKDWFRKLDVRIEKKKNSFFYRFNNISSIAAWCSNVANVAIWHFHASFYSWHLKVRHKYIWVTAFMCSYISIFFNKMCCLFDSKEINYFYFRKK